MKIIKRFLRWFDNDRNISIVAIAISVLSLIAGDLDAMVSWMCLGILFLVLSYLKDIYEQGRGREIHHYHLYVKGTPNGQPQEDQEEAGTSTHTG